MANNLQPWAAYRALMLGSLVGLDNFTGVRPVGVGETWRRMMEKCVLVVTGVEAKEACRKEHLCSGFEAGIEGQGGTAAGVGGVEGRPVDPESLDSRRGQHSRHVCREY